MDESLLARVEALRIPLEDPSSPMDWKDWYHFILFDPQRGIRVLVNVTLMGRPNQGQIQVSFIVNLPSDQMTLGVRPDPSLATFGTTFCLPWTEGMVQPHPLRLHGQGIMIEMNGKHSVVTVEDPRAQLSVRWQGEAQAMPLLVTEDAPFGSGFIGWGLVPGLQVRGELSVCGQSYPINPDWFCYHDRNFGRFRWGEDIGWEWFVAHGADDQGQPITLILDRRTSKDHADGGLPYIFIYLGQELRKVFLGSTLSIGWQWSSTSALPIRLPGIMASVFADRTLRSPQALRVQAADEQDQLLLNVEFEAMTELIVPDNQQRQYTFIAEVTGNVEVSLSLAGKTQQVTGLLYGEYVH